MEIEIKESWMGIVCIIFGLLVLVFDDLLRWLIGIFALLIGIAYLLKSSTKGTTKSNI